MSNKPIITGQVKKGSRMQEVVEVIDEIKDVLTWNHNKECKMPYRDCPVIISGGDINSITDSDCNACIISIVREKIKKLRG